MESKKDFFKRLDELFQKGLKEFSARKKEKEKIEELVFELTYRCNLRCIMCDLWKRDKRHPELRKQELSLEEIKTLVNQSKLLSNLKVVVLTGGEPFLREDIVEIAGFFLQRYPGIFLGILTNLFDTEKVLIQTKKIVEKYHPKDLWFSSSLDGIGATHDMMRGRKGAFDSLLKTLKKLDREFPQITCSLVFTLTPKNCRELFPAYRLAQELHCWFSAQVVVQGEYREKFYWGKEHLKIIKEQVDVVLDNLYTNFRKISPLLKKNESSYFTTLLAELFFWGYITKYIETPQRYFKYCFAGKKSAMFHPWGELFSCPVEKKEIGNIRNRSFDELWLSERMNKIRKYVDEERCHCWLYCTVMPGTKEIFRCTYSTTNLSLKRWV